MAPRTRCAEPRWVCLSSTCRRVGGQKVFCGGLGGCELDGNKQPDAFRAIVAGAFRAIVESDFGTNAVTDGANDSQSEPTPLRPIGAWNAVESLEHARALRGWNTWTGVLDLQPGDGPVDANPYIHGAALSIVANGVIQQIGGQLADEHLGTEYGDRTVRPLHLDLDPGRECLGVSVGDQLRDDLAQIADRLRRALRTLIGAGQSDQLARHVIEAPNRAIQFDQGGVYDAG